MATKLTQAVFGTGCADMQGAAGSYTCADEVCMATKLMQSDFGTGSADKTRMSANENAAEVIVRRAAVKKLANVANDSLHVGSR